MTQAEKRDGSDKAPWPGLRLEGGVLGCAAPPGTPLSPSVSQAGLSIYTHRALAN